ncbi:hypothetical protein ACOMHN_052008 [Nucella lapillus]
MDTLEKERKKSKRLDRRRAAVQGQSDITPSPSYAIYGLLKPRLADTGRQVDYIRGDGNCFFRALSKELYGSEDFHTDWREAVCDLIESHPCVFSPFVDGGCVSKHLHLMRQLGSWATSCEIYGAATLLRREVYVLAPSHSGQKEYNWLLFRPCSLVCRNKAENGGEGCGHEANDDDDEEEDEEGEEGEGEEEGEGIHPCYITLCLTNGNHYDRIRPLGSGLCNCQLAPPSLNRHTLLMDSTPRRGGRGAQDGGHFHFDWHGAG